MPVLLSGDLLRVLLVSPSSATRTELGDGLSGAGELRYYWISQPDLALARAQNLAPHVIVVDDDLGDARPNDLVRDLVSGVPGAVVMALVRPDSLEAARAMVLAGARAILTKPIQPDLLIGTLRQSLGRREAEAPRAETVPATGRMIVFCGSKGGTGRTTLAINTAVSLVDVARETVVIIDADYSAPALDVSLDTRHQRDITDLLPKLSALDADLMDNVLATHSSGVRVLLAPMPDVRTSPPTVEQIEQIVSSLRRMYAWVLVDLGLPIDDAGYAFLDHADCIIMSVLPEMVALRNARTMLRQFEGRNYLRARVWPTVNREGMGGSVPTSEVTTYLGRDVRWTIPNDQELATETINRGVPMVISHRRRPLAQRYRALARELLDDQRKVQAGGGLAAVERPAAFAPAPLNSPFAADERLATSGVQEVAVSSTALPIPVLASPPAAALPEPAPAKSHAAAPASPSRSNGHIAPEPSRAPQPAAKDAQGIVLRILAGVGGLALLGGLAYGVMQLIH